jgi:putative FmdB family regulatory protein
MPVYSYQCDNCGYSFERRQKFTDPHITVCPNCHKKRVRKLLTTPSIVFKGSGWYSTDHRSPSGAHTGGSSSSSVKKSSDGTADKTTEKVESKSPSGDD